jgi:hypothetical protein
MHAGEKTLAGVPLYWSFIPYGIHYVRQLIKTD